MKIIRDIKRWAKRLKEQLIILQLSYLDTRTPLVAKALIFMIIAYALSPIDLIPDFIPVLGYLDDLILLPLGIGLAIKLIPNSVIVHAKAKAQEYDWKKKKSLTGLIIIVSLWLLIVFYFGLKLI